MGSVTLKPNEVLRIVWNSTDSNGLRVESSYVFTYEELLQRLKAGKAKSKKSNTAGRKFSRLVALYTRAIYTGTWSTGASMPVPLAVDSLLEAFSELDSSEYSNITNAAKGKLGSLYYDVVSDSISIDKSRKADLLSMFKRLSGGVV